MSTTAPEQTSTDDVATFRGRSLAELLPQIRDQLGPEAVVLKQRDGLMGGIGGFFQQRFVEVDARAGAARVDVYDEPPASPAAPEPEQPAEPEPFAQLLAAAEEAGPRIRPAPTGSNLLSSSEPTPFGAQPATLAHSLTHELIASGMSHAFAERLTEDAEAHELPFTGGDPREAVRRALARRLPVSLPHRAGGLTVAFAGPGSTGCADALASAYKDAGRDARAIASLDKARALMERGTPDAVIAIDLPPIATERAEADALAARVQALQLDDVVVAIPVELDLLTARALLDRLQPLSPTALAVTLDDPNAEIGAALELACTTRLPIAYVHAASTGIAPADPTTLAERLLP
jgi:Meckel syndrome type 1 protein